MKRWGLIIYALFGCIGFVSAQSLPQWSPEDQALLKKGELVVGVSLLVESETPDVPRAVLIPEDSDTTEVSIPEVVVPFLPEAEYEATLIPEEYLNDYFSKTPETYFIDPQRLFSNQETLDREGFLEYYADESDVDVRIYLFDAQQEIPAYYTMQRLVDDLYIDGPLTAVVFYFLGNPERNQLLFGGKGAELVSSEKLRRMLESSAIKAMEKSDHAAQMESFLIQLSISIYWIEEAIAEARGEEVAGLAEPQLEGERLSVSKPGIWTEAQPYLLYTVIGVMSGGLVVIALGMAWVWWRRSRRYRFPVLDLPRRLGADYAAGIGAVIGFHNKLDSPSSQRDQIPDYLIKL